MPYWTSSLRTVALPVLAALGLVHAAPALAVTFSVTSTTDAVDVAPGDGLCATAEGACTLRAAVMEANALAGADEIVLGAGVHFLDVSGLDENGGATGDLDVTDDLVLRGTGWATSKIDGLRRDRVLDIHGTIVVGVEDLTVQNGDGVEIGGCLRNRGGDVTLTGLALARCNASVQGAAISNAGSLALVDTHVGDSAGTAMAAIWNLEAARFEESSVNRSAGWGIFNQVGAALNLVGGQIKRNTRGGIFNYGTLTATGVDISFNGDSINWETAGVNSQGPATIDHCVVIGNGRTGIELRPDDANGTQTVTGSIVRENVGYGILVPGGNGDDGSSLIADTEIIANEIGLSAGGDYCTLRIERCAIEGSENGGIYAGGRLVEILNSQILNNRRTKSLSNLRFWGGGILSLGATVRIVDSVVAGNDSPQRGGAIYNSSNLEIVGSLFSGNSAPDGGAIYNSDGTVSVAETLFVSNTADQGAAIFNRFPVRSGEVSVENVTFDQNEADLGSAIYNDVDASVHLVHTTIVDTEEAPNHYFIFNDGSLEARNSILVASGGGCEGQRLLDSGGFNIAFAPNCGLAEAEDLGFIDPLLDALADRGGPTETFALLPGSPAVGAIPAEFCPETDQRGWRRVGDACAVGAFEPDAAPCTDADGDGFFAEGDLCGPADCDDANTGVNPGALEIPGNEIDEDCDPLTPAGCMVEMPVAEAAEGGSAERAGPVDLSFTLLVAFLGGTAVRRRARR